MPNNFFSVESKLLFILSTNETLATNRTHSTKLTKSVSLLKSFRLHSFTRLCNNLWLMLRDKIMRAICSNISHEIDRNSWHARKQPKLWFYFLSQHWVRTERNSSLSYEQSQTALLKLLVCWRMRLWLVVLSCRSWLNAWRWSDRPQNAAIALVIIFIIVVKPLIIIGIVCYTLNWFHFLIHHKRLSHSITLR